MLAPPQLARLPDRGEGTDQPRCERYEKVGSSSIERRRMAKRGAPRVENGGQIREKHTYLPSDFLVVQSISHGDQAIRGHGDQAINGRRWRKGVVAESPAVRD
ncbi:hypothetical protein PR202_ga16555 [Eleusine coracana subsp. coracana]|uniref:Uncharacterized protein n=1 Tax=Eleusine coracana subsp. coracana TaxID=191504 RepID=A0AAV5CM07_ELECO|nr:hypothetical protein PR202_ga16555 [Eleusine coracana subsp. coracana]